MERAKLRIDLPPELRDEVVAMLRSLIGPVSVSSGCLECGLYQDVVDENTLYWEEEWRTRDDMYRHIASTQYRQILAVLDLATTKPDVRFEHVSNRLGMELIALVRSNHQ